jgi:hypothetical protein
MIYQSHDLSLWIGWPHMRLQMEGQVCWGQRQPNLTHLKKAHDGSHVPKAQPQWVRTFLCVFFVLSYFLIEKLKSYVSIMHNIFWIHCIITQLRRLTCYCFTYFFFVVRTLKIYSLGNFQEYNTVNTILFMWFWPSVVRKKTNY